MPTVLVLDEDEAVASTLAMVLKGARFVAHAVYRPLEALFLARQIEFDFLISDVMMEPINGVETAIAFAELHPSAHIILMSGTPDTARLLADSAEGGTTSKFWAN